MTHLRPSRRPVGALALALVAGVTSPAAVAPAAAQSLLDRPPNLSGDFVGRPGTVHFNFLHRFIAGDAPERKVSNFPTFFLAAGITSRALVGLHYSTNSTLAPRYPNEWEFFGRFALLSEDRGSPLDLAGQVGYNLAAEGVDGEVSLAKRIGPVRAIVATRVLSNPYEEGNTQVALGAGGTVRLTRHVALAGDVAALTDRDEARGEKVAWSAGLHLAIPNSPHTLSLQVTNTNTATLQGASRGGSERRYGFEFVVPITLARYFGGRPKAPPPPAQPPAEPPAAAGRTVDAAMRSLAFVPARVEIAAGTTIVWRNDDQLAHTVTADDGSWDSGVIQPGAAWRRTFDRPGTYPFHCTPHPFMKGTVVVK
ncbi:MAG TPA: cupredoxin family copper-binding protein [Gemmatimonadales bacterium]|nr:cupredoxin family copper-binding protein [Gemmatimonadales bacterium]